MATKSFTKNIDIRDKKLGKSLVSALENASNKKSKDVSLSRTYSEASNDTIRKIFGKSK